ncbi:MAG: hypothetical protein GEV11_14475 [Streptosporangiales bacterium]|nr:hypothetical protein [Streptosporangiales bacterium]
MDEYLAGIAATTGGLYEALLAPEVDDALLDGAGGILAALALRGPAEDMTDYPDAVPALHRLGELLKAADPTLDRLSDLLTLVEFVRRGDSEEGAPGMRWPKGEPGRLRDRYERLVALPRWREVVRAHLAAPVGPLGFNHALRCAGLLGVPALDRAREYLALHPDAEYVRRWIGREEPGPGG